MGKREINLDLGKDLQETHPPPIHAEEFAQVSRGPGFRPMAQVLPFPEAPPDSGMLKRQGALLSMLLY